MSALRTLLLLVMTIRITSALQSKHVSCTRVEVFYYCTNSSIIQNFHFLSLALGFQVLMVVSWYLLRHCSTWSESDSSITSARLHGSLPLTRLSDIHSADQPSLLSYALPIFIKSFGYRQHLGSSFDILSSTYVCIYAPFLNHSGPSVWLRTLWLLVEEESGSVEIEPIHKII